jgi:hypothetical protein
MSLLASELGGSQLVTSERKDHERMNNSNKNLKEFMNSIDMRIIKNMQEDTPVFRDRPFFQ